MNACIEIAPPDLPAVWFVCAVVALVLLAYATIEGKKR